MKQTNKTTTKILPMRLINPNAYFTWVNLKKINGKLSEQFINLGFSHYKFRYLLASSDTFFGHTAEDFKCPLSRKDMINTQLFYFNKLVEFPPMLVKKFHGYRKRLYSNLYLHTEFQFTSLHTMQRCLYWQIKHDYDIQRL